MTQLESDPDYRSPPSRLARKLGAGDAVVIGLGSMIGAGVFAAIGPAAGAAGAGLLVGLLVAAVVAFCNATSSAALAALYPESGGTYVYGRKRLGRLWGFLAGWGFVVGKLASCAAMALTFAQYAWPAHGRVLAVVAATCLTAVNYLGVAKTALLTRAIVAFVLGVLAFVVMASLSGGTVDGARLGGIAHASLHGVLQAAGLLFFAFAGYARIATLGEEVVDPARTISRAIPLALGITLVVYAAVAVSALLALDADQLARASAPLAAVVEAGRWAAFAPWVRAGAAVAALGVMVSLLAGVSRTVFAMADQGDLPRFLAAVHPRYRIPHRAELAVGALVVAVLLFADVRGAIGFSSFAVLAYYAIANASALTLKPFERRWPRALAAAGLAGCLLLAFSLPVSSIIGGGAVLLAGAISFHAKNRNKSGSDSN